MKEIDKILSFTDNALSDADEVSLFRELAESGEMRQAFKSHLRIKSSAPRIYQEAAPSAASTSALFGKLGLDYGAGASAPAVAASAPAASSQPLYWEPGIAAVFAAIAVIAMLLFAEPLEKNYMAEGSATNNTVTEEIAQVSTQDSKAADIPVSSSATTLVDDKSMENSINKLRAENDALRKELAYNRHLLASAQGRINTLQAQLASNDGVSNKPSFIFSSEPISASKLYISQWDGFGWSDNGEMIVLNANSEDFPRNGIYGDKSLELEDASLFGLDLGTDLAVEYRNYNYWNIGPERLSPKSSDLFSNEALIVRGSLYKELDLFVDVRQENFNLQFSGVENGREYQYETYPSTVSAALGLRQNYAFNDELRIYGEISSGVSGLGAIGRAGLGLSVTPLPYVSVFGGYEYSGLIFDYQGRNFSSQKSGMYYGISLNL